MNNPTTLKHVAICGSLDFTAEIKELADSLTSMGIAVDIPHTSRRIFNGETSVEEIKAEKANGKFADRAIKFDSIREYWSIIQNSDAILVANFEKKGISGYIGGNTFLEMGFAHVLRKPIFLLKEIPETSYTDEIRAMQPTILNDDLASLNPTHHPAPRIHD